MLKFYRIYFTYSIIQNQKTEREHSWIEEIFSKWNGEAKSRCENRSRGTRKEMNY